VPPCSPFAAPVTNVGVVVPARNEQDNLGACLAAVRKAGAFLQRSKPWIRIHPVVVLDRCTDRTAAVAAAAQIHTVDSRHGRVGAARRLGVAALLDGQLRVDHWWLACTDADSVVPRNWLVSQLQLAAAGVDLVLGTVLPVGLDRTLERAWRARHDLSDGHGHVFGANLGIRADRYLAVGGFPDLATGEDVALAHAVQRMGGSVRASGGHPVLTSGRRRGRAPDGLAGYLDALGSEAAKAAACRIREPQARPSRAATDVGAPRTQTSNTMSSSRYRASDESSGAAASLSCTSSPERRWSATG
jgi:hypothetical protein